MTKSSAPANSSPFDWKASGRTTSSDQERMSARKAEDLRRKGAARVQSTKGDLHGSGAPSQVKIRSDK
ncbi:hypothetical protein QTH91_15545 [Variovorax dokdonensis]|uniref:DUF2188 domain-containing protein n=1 Tax=Variovorax dokdonensis TaxID=344883 RepID=A0ABT7ND79_9BURK|nr:hypothetical protein [Variovorax dokdonensis]MDM0045902.1 hypothetical protein [Variovorax dokdonensis]